MEGSNKNKYNEFSSDLEDIESLDISLNSKYISLKRILERFCKELTDNEVLQFPSLFSRIVFISQKYKLKKSLEWELQNIRVKSTFLLKNEENKISQSDYESAIKNIKSFLSIIYNKEVGEESDVLPSYTPVINVDIPERIRVQVVNIDKENDLIYCKSDNPNNDFVVRFNIPNVNDIFNSTIEKLWIGAQLNLLDSTIEQKTNYIIPKFIVLEPDYLIDASALAECFQNYGTSHLHYFRRKFEPNSNSKHILLGNLSNFFLDELVYSENPESSDFQDSFIKAFKRFPFEYSSCNEIKERADFIEFMNKAEMQFNNIKRVICSDFLRNNIITKNCILEPSFFCEKFGFQGRLDLLQLESNDGKNNTINIVELKSGGLPYPKHDASRISINHEAQTTIYRLIIQSVFRKNPRDIFSMILYSAAENKDENLRLSASYQKFEKEIVNIRNLIVANEHDLYSGNNDHVNAIFQNLTDLNNYGGTPQFFIDRLDDIQKTVDNISDIEKIYFYRFIRFVSKDLYIQKTGSEIYDSSSGNATLWNTQFKERLESYDLISDLKIIDIDDESGNDMVIKFEKPFSNSFVNFREGEICILYPRDSEQDTILSNQILKGVLVEIKSNEVVVRFRYKQKNKTYLRKYNNWVIEHDKLDHSYNEMFKSLFSFISAPLMRRNLLLGISRPESSYNELSIINESYEAKEKENVIIKKAIQAQDYFLIVGPPGTGKTSIFARRLIESFYNNPEQNILVIAYTNRAVDELCETINNTFGYEDGQCNLYIRIGTELSCKNIYRHRLLQNISSEVQSRDELRNIINNQRIYVGTLASILGKPELFDFKKFHVAIIDEASQILEPQIIGLLAKLDKFIMIGDHKQLSTITLQNTQSSNVTEQELNEIELNDCRESYFERMFRVCQKNGWNQAYDTLIYQGRMHEELSRFPNLYFYENQLKTISDWQKEDLANNQINAIDAYSKLISEKRLSFINSKIDSYSSNDKICKNEADIAVNLAIASLNVYKQNKIPFNNETTLGIITPYRNQIALIKHKLEETNIPELQNIMIDTVERYQGSQRDIIILSFCINKSYQLNFMSNLNKEGLVDRKLNVALTRARKQLFMIGKENILRQNRLYDILLNNTEITFV